MSIFPLAQFESDVEAARQDAEAYDRLNAPKTLVVRFGALKLVGEFPYSGDAKPGCGSKIVVRSHRGTEIGEMLTSTCPNAGCSKSVTRKEMLEYIENSGGKDYPFFTGGRALRVATIEDMNEQARLNAQVPAMRKFAQAQADEHQLEMKVVDVEPILGRERLTFYFTAEDRIDFRELVQVLAREYTTRIEMRQVGARDEARLVADYERCGQHCCCKQFLKVLKPISIRSAKTQKATLDPLKISGRCGRLMCCLRYEDQTYTELEKRLPRMKKRVGTPHGIGVVVDRQILTQLVLVRLEESAKAVAVAVEEIVPPEEVDRILLKEADPLRGMSPERVAQRSDGARAGGPSRPKEEQQDRYREQSQRMAPPRQEGEIEESERGSTVSEQGEGSEGAGKKRRSRRRRRGGGGSGSAGGEGRGSSGAPRPGPSGGGGGSSSDEGGSGGSTDGGGGKRRRRRRGGRKLPGSGSGGSGGGSE